MQYRTRKQINDLISRHSIIPLFNPDDFEVCKNVIKAAYEGGVRLFECTNRSANALEIFRKLVPVVQSEMPDLALGAGTIMDDAAARNFYEAGAQFIVSPVITEEVANFCQTHEMFWCPGAATMNEIVTAHNMGADLVKIFPANFAGGPAFVKAIKAPCPWLRLMPTGGVDGSPENLKAWFESGVECVGIGSQLFTKELLSKKDYGTITMKTREIVRTIELVRSKK